MAVCDLLMRFPVSGDLERSAGSLADLVQLVLQGIDLPFHLLEGATFRRDEQAPILAPGVAQDGNPDACGVVRSPGWMSSSKAPSTCMGASLPI
jgi:hypothetical protein